MTSRARTFVVLLAVFGVAAFLPAPGAVWAGAPAAALPTLPAAESVRAYDRPSDDGSTLIVEWAKPEGESKGITYVIEMAESKEDFAAGRFVTKTVKPSKKALKFANQKYFGYSKKNRGIYFAAICPADLLKARPPFRLTGKRVSELLAAGDLTAAEAARATAALASEKPAHDLTETEKADREWLEWLERYLPRRARLEQFRAVQLVTPQEFDRAAKALGNDKPDDKLTPEELGERDWLGKFEGSLSRTFRLKRIAQTTDLLSPAQFDRAAEVLKDLRPDDKLTAEEKSERAWLKWLETYLAKRPWLESLVKKGALPRKHFDRAAKILAISKPEDALSDAEKSDRRWLDRLEAYLNKKEDETRQADRREANQATYCFRLAVRAHRKRLYVTRDGEPLIFAAHAEPNWFKRFKLTNLVFALIFSGIVVAFIQAARRNPNLFIRKIAGLEAVEEAIGRATEMGRSVYFVHGLGGMGTLATIAAVNILARVGRRAAEYDTRVRVMNNEPIVTAVSQEVVKQAYTEAGRPDAYNDDDVSLVAFDQFSYVAAVAGRMVRERPAAVFLIGYFYAESLLLAETGAATGAIQVAGTDAYTQLPFFVTTCDYTLIGEELYAASAYLSREPKMLGSLRGQDVGKAFLMLVIVAGAAVMTVGVAVGMDLGWIRWLFQAF